MERLSDRERETLRLLGRGHEAKSIASALDVSVHTVNERLRAARRKLGVTSSREAARVLLAHEAGPAVPNNIGYKKIGVPLARADESYWRAVRLGPTGTKRRLTWIVIGVLMLTILVSVLMATHSGGNGPDPIVSLPRLFRVTDYPAKAVAQHAQGITDFRLRVSADGRVEKCDIERSSGSAALDQATCRIITQRSRFRPATDAAGHAVDSVYTGMIHWLL